MRQRVDWSVWKRSLKCVKMQTEVCPRVVSTASTSLKRQTTFSQNDPTNPAAGRGSSLMISVFDTRGMIELRDSRAKQPLQVACVCDYLNCWGAWDLTCEAQNQGHNSIDHLEDWGVQRGKRKLLSIKYVITEKQCSFRKCFLVVFLKWDLRLFQRVLRCRLIIETQCFQVK